MFSKSLPIIEIHNRVYALQNITNFIGWYARVNWQCFAKNSQNNGRLILAAKTDLKLFWAVYSISHHIKCHLIDLYNYDCSMINYYICNNKWEWKTAQVETLALWPIRDHHRIYITIYNYIYIIWDFIKRFLMAKNHMVPYRMSWVILWRSTHIYVLPDLTHWGRVTHICVVKLTIIASDNGLSPGRRQAIIWTNAGLLSIGPLGTQFIEILIGIQTFSFKKMHLKMSSAKWRPLCLGLNVLTVLVLVVEYPEIIGLYDGGWCSGCWRRLVAGNHGMECTYKSDRLEIFPEIHILMF